MMNSQRTSAQKIEEDLSFATVAGGRLEPLSGKMDGGGGGGGEDDADEGNQEREKTKGHGSHFVGFGWLKR